MVLTLIIEQMMTTRPSMACIRSLPLTDQLQSNSIRANKNDNNVSSVTKTMIGRWNLKLNYFIIKKEILFFTNLLKFNTENQTRNEYMTWLGQRGL